MAASAPGAPTTASAAAPPICAWAIPMVSVTAGAPVPSTKNVATPSARRSPTASGSASVSKGPRRDARAPCLVAHRIPSVPAAKSAIVPPGLARTPRPGDSSLALRARRAPSAIRGFAQWRWEASARGVVTASTPRAARPAFTATRETVFCGEGLCRAGNPGSLGLGGGVRGRYRLRLSVLRCGHLLSALSGRRSHSVRGGLHLPAWPGARVWLLSGGRQRRAAGRCLHHQRRMRDLVVRDGGWRGLVHPLLRRCDAVHRRVQLHRCVGCGERVPRCASPRGLRVRMLGARGHTVPAAAVAAANGDCCARRVAAPLWRLRLFIGGPAHRRRSVGGHERCATAPAATERPSVVSVATHDGDCSAVGAAVAHASP